MKNTLCHFHIGRGGRFNNQGYKSFRGFNNIGEVLSNRDNSGKWTFLNKENEVEIYNILNKRHLPNLMELFNKCSDNSDFTEFEKRTGLELGENVYNDSNGTQMITEAEVESGEGCLNWDYGYDTDIVCKLSDCDEDDLKLIADTFSDWEKNFYSEIWDYICDELPHLKETENNED
jgi:hypothetical protein